MICRRYLELQASTSCYETLKSQHPNQKPRSSPGATPRRDPLLSLARGLCDEEITYISAKCEVK